MNQQAKDKIEEINKALKSTLKPRIGLQRPSLVSVLDSIKPPYTPIKIGWAWDDMSLFEKFRWWTCNCLFPDIGRMLRKTKRYPRWVSLDPRFDIILEVSMGITISVDDGGCIGEGITPSELHRKLDAFLFEATPGIDRYDAVIRQMKERFEYLLRRIDDDRDFVAEHGKSSVPIFDDLYRIASDAKIGAENVIKYLEKELGEPTLQCSDCGSTGPFNGVTYPSSPNGPEEYDIKCEECGSLNVSESPSEAFCIAESRWGDEFQKAEKEWNEEKTKLIERISQLDTMRDVTNSSTNNQSDT